MAVVVSLINMKGGVGKTTLAAQLAHAADHHDLRTLAIDLDPQSNLSQAILGAKKYVEVLKAKSPTVAAIFEQYLPPTEANSAPTRVKVEDTVLKKVGHWQNSTLDLIPSRLELSQTLKNPTGKERRLAKEISKLESNYDLIIIDCAPTESILTLAAYHCSRYLLVPVKPEFLATIGLPLLEKSIQDFKYENSDHDLDVCGIIFNHSSAYSQGPEGETSIAEVEDDAKKNGWKVFKTHLRYSASYPKAARQGTPIVRTRNSRKNVANEFQVIFTEFLKAVGITK